MKHSYLKQAYLDFQNVPESKSPQRRQKLIYNVQSFEFQGKFNKLPLIKILIATHF